MKQLFLILNLMKTISSQSICPFACLCKSVQNYPIASCNNLNLTSIPDGLEINTKLLDLSRNLLNQIENKIFHKKSLSMIKMLNLSRNEIGDIQPDGFFGLLFIQRLDLSSNKLQEIPSLSFINIPTLVYLNLSENPIYALRYLAFVTLPRLMVLDLSSSNILSIERHTFTGLLSLEKLDSHK